MYPSESKRHFFLFLSDYRVIRAPFYFFGAIAMLAGAVMGIIFRGRMLTAHNTVNGVSSTSQISSWIVCGSIFAFGLLFVLVARFFITGIGKWVMKQPPYPVRTDRRISRDELLARAEYELTQQNPLWDVKVNGNWIDVTWNWKDVVGVDSLAAMGVRRSMDTYSKLVEIGDDYTYQELDMRRRGDFGVGPTGIHLHKSWSVGHMTSFEIEIVPGVDLKDQAKPGIQTYRLSTAEIGDAVHEWLAGYGYSYR